MSRSDRSKTWLTRAVVPVILMSLLISACSKAKEDRVAEPAGQTAGEMVTGDWLVRHLSSEPATLNPITATDAYESVINGYIYESLLQLDNETLELVPRLAESWEVSEDKLQFTFTLKEGLHWQDGKPLTTEDILYTFDRVKDPLVDAPHLRSYYKDLKKVEALDDKTVRFTYAFPYFKALDMIGGLSILPRHIFGSSEGQEFNAHPSGREPVGSGPYRFVKWETGKEIVLERYPDYWGKKHYLDRIVFKIITDTTVALQVLKKQEMDFMGLTPIQWVRQTDSERFNSNFDKLRYPSLGYSYVGWNLRKPMFADRKVRRALTMLLDRQEFVENIWYGLGRVVSGNFFIDTPEYDKSILPLPYDPEGALKLLEEAGWTDHDGDGIIDKDGTPFRFEFTYSSGSTTGEQLGTILKESLKKVGIEMTIRQLEWALFTQLLDDRAFDAVTLGWSLPVLADPYQVWHSSQAERGSNFVGFVNGEADRIIEEARSEFDREKRSAMYRRFHRILHEEQPYTFLFSRDSLVVLEKRYENVKVYPLGPDSTEWYVPAKDQRYR
ncbi:MAG: peptide-binding protein [bacterium]|nr:MAG: peptide-binding protein [bacterium]